LRSPCSNGEKEDNIEEVSKMPDPEVEKQNQVITSADNKLAILHHAGSIDNFGCYSIKGAVRNLSPESNVEVEIKVDYFDAAGAKIDTEIDNLYIPQPGGSRGFIIIYPGLYHDDIRSYKIFPSLKTDN
jgi:hypothetical protein